MAKKVKIKKAGEYNLNITYKTKDTTYVFSNETVAEGTCLKFNTECYNPVYARSGNDLYICLTYGEDPKYKHILTTIKDYYKYCEENNGLVEIYGYSVYNDAIYDAREYINSKTFDVAVEGGEFLLGRGATTFNIKNTDTAKTLIYDIGGKDKYKVVGLLPTSGYVFTKEMAGNDSYEITGSRGVIIEDYTGSDKYVIKDCYEVIGTNSTSDEAKMGDLYICDYSGNDTWIFDNVKSTTEYYVYMYDDAGKDKYILNDILRTNLEDYAGNDKYTVGASEGKYSEDLYIEDYSGNDVYKINNTKNIDIVDGENNYYYGVKGSDKYTMTDCYNLSIDDSYGKDKYVMKNIKTALAINDCDGQNDSYTISGSENVTIYEDGGKEMYKISNTSGLIIIDDYENGLEGDKYNITNTSNIQITDANGKDTYNISGSYDKKTKTINYSENVEITDSYSVYYAGAKTDNDKYNLTYVRNTYNIKDKWTIQDEFGANTFNIKECDGISIKTVDTYETSKDTYNITSSKNVFIDDRGYASDVYKVKLAEKGGVIIKDSGGEGDKLTISNLNKNNLVFMTNYNTNNTNNTDSDKSIILFDTKTGGFVQICNIYCTNSSHADIYETDFFDNGNTGGFMETVKAGKKSVDITNSDMINKLNEVRANVAAFLGSNNSVMDVLNSGDDAQIQQLVQLFQGGALG